MIVKFFATFWIISLACIGCQAVFFGYARPGQTICLNAVNQTIPFRSRCVVCPANTFQQTMSRCLLQRPGIDQLTVAEANCIAQSCGPVASSSIGNPYSAGAFQFTGRKRRAATTTTSTATGCRSSTTPENVKVTTTSADKKATTGDVHVTTVSGIASTAQDEATKVRERPYVREGRRITL